MSRPASNPLTSLEWKLVLLLSAINFTHVLDFVIVMPLGDQLRHELAIMPQQFGFVVSAYGICAMIAGVIAAAVIDRFDRRLDFPSVCRWRIGITILVRPLLLLRYSNRSFFWLRSGCSLPRPEPIVITEFIQSGCWRMSPVSPITYGRLRL